MLSFNAALLVIEQQMGTQAAISKIRLIQPRVVVKTASYAELGIDTEPEPTPAALDGHCRARWN
jgi:hypothetical protein